jgi:hypothetical protein
MVTARIERLLLAAVFLGGAWALWNGVGYALNPATRYRAEAAWFIFSVILLVSGAALRTPATIVTSVDDRRLPSLGILGGLVALSFVLYARSLGLGLLSDDFVLLDRARQSRLIDSQWEYVRPLPLASWRVLVGIIAADHLPTALHALNIAIHAINGWLVFRVSRAFAVSDFTAGAGAALFVVAPYHVEPVTWVSGIFDVSCTLFVLCAALTIIRRSGLLAHVGVALLTVLAISCKETAVATPLLLAILIPVVPRDRRRDALISVAVSGMVVVAYSLWRITLMSTSPLPEAPSGYALKEIVSRPFGVLGFGIHRKLLDMVPALGIALAIFWPVLFIRSAYTWTVNRASYIRLGIAVSWVLASVLPLFWMLFVGDDLQGSRYLYLGSTVWTLAVAAALLDRSAPAMRLATGVMVVLVIGSFVITWRQQESWLAAAAARDRLLEALQHESGRCASMRVEGAPDHVDGAYVFRNGLEEAVNTLALTASEAECRFLWDGRQLTPAAR